MKLKEIEVGKDYALRLGKDYALRLGKDYVVKVTVLEGHCDRHRCYQPCRRQHGGLTMTPRDLRTMTRRAHRLDDALSTHLRRIYGSARGAEMRYRSRAWTDPYLIRLGRARDRAVRNLLNARHPGAQSPLLPFPGVTP